MQQSYRVRCVKRGEEHSKYANFFVFLLELAVILKSWDNNRETAPEVLHCVDNNYFFFFFYFFLNLIED